MPEGSPTQTAIRARALPVIAASRVDAIVSLHAETIGDAEDAFPAVQAVESFWRELNGHGDGAAFRLAARPRVVDLQAEAARSESPWASAVVAALDCIVGLIDMPTDRPHACAVAVGSALSVALEFDCQGLTPPAGSATWYAFEAAGQAAAADQLFAEAVPLTKTELFNLRMEAGSGAMHYSRAMKEWIRRT